MHIPENYLSPSTCAVLGAVMLPVWITAVKKNQRRNPERKITADRNRSGIFIFEHDV